VIGLDYIAFFELDQPAVLYRTYWLLAQKRGRMPTMKSNPLRPHTPDDDPEPGTPGTAEDLCPECAGTGKLVDKVTRKQSACERCDGTGIIIQGVG
jgi:hypothetical protein